LVLLAACSPSPAPTPAPAPEQTAPPSPSPSPPPAQTEAPRTAPAEALDVATKEMDFRRGRDRPLPTTVWYPTEGDKPFPLIVFSHGLTSEPSAYESVLRPWAEAGFVVAAPTFPHTHYRTKDFDALDVINQPADVSEVITRMLATDSSGLIDPDRIAAAGHSAGGITTIGLFSGNRDDRLKAGVVLSGRLVLNLPFTGDAAPMLFVHGKLDKTVAYSDGLAAFNAVPWPKAMMAVTKGGHVAITKDFEPVIATTTDFLRYALYGDTAAKNRLSSDATEGKRATLIDKL
jgi:fermentation-respiration switch protein FrsA (DUF1100 family)